MRGGIFTAFLFGLFTVAAHSQTLPEAPKDSNYRSYPQAKAKLGQLLFYDRILSGTYRVSCATCHNHDRASSNGFRLDGKLEGEGEGDTLAVNDQPVYEPFKPSSKHAPPLFNLGAKEFKTLFSDGRVAVKTDGGFVSPAGEQLPDGLSDVLAVQALFPAVNSGELVGTVDSDIVAVAHLGNPAIWDALAKRVRNLPDYWPHFQSAFPELQGAKKISMVEIANAIAAFVGTEWRSDQSPFDAYLRGDISALDEQQKRGLTVFYGKGKCASCHSGAFQTDNKFHHLSMPVWRFDEKFEKGTGDIQAGRVKVTGEVTDMFHFRTPSLRNVAVTAPYGQAGAFKTLEEVVRHHLDPVQGYVDFLAARPTLKMTRIARGNTFQFFKTLNDMPEIALTDAEIGDLIAFLGSLTDPVSLKGRLGKPVEVPSSLALD